MAAADAVGTCYVSVTSASHEVFFARVMLPRRDEEPDAAARYARAQSALLVIRKLILEGYREPEPAIVIRHLSVPSELSLAIPRGPPNGLPRLSHGARHSTASWPVSLCRLAALAQAYRAAGHHRLHI